MCAFFRAVRSLCRRASQRHASETLHQCPSELPNLPGLSELYRAQSTHSAVPLFIHLFAPSFAGSIRRAPHHLAQRELLRPCKAGFARDPPDFSEPGALASAAAGRGFVVAAAAVGARFAGANRLELRPPREAGRGKVAGGIGSLRDAVLAWQRAKRACLDVPRSIRSDCATAGYGLSTWEPAGGSVLAGRDEIVDIFRRLKSGGGR